MKYRCILSLIFILFAGVNAGTILHAPQTISYQGFLSSGGIPISDGSYTLIFSLFTVPSGGSALWTESDTGVSVQSGSFSVILGTGTSLSAVNFNQQLFIEVQEGANPPFAPRSPLTSAPSALAPWAISGNTVNYPNGNAGIGVPNPAYKLDVNGIVNATDFYKNGSPLSGGLTLPFDGTDSNQFGPVFKVTNSPATGGFGAIAGWDHSTIGTGVFGIATAATGTTYGIYGNSQSQNGTGVYGLAGAGSGANYGTVGRTSSPSGTGVYGYADASSGSAKGVYGETHGPTGAALVGLSASTTGKNFGILASSSSAAGYAAYFNGNLTVMTGKAGIGTETPGERLTVAGSMEVGTGAGDYEHFRIGGGNSSGFLYGSYPRFADGIHLGYNYYATGVGSNYVIANTGGATSRLTLGYGYIGLYVGGVNAEPLTTGLFVGGSGNVGIGTESPGYRLQVGSSGDGSQARANAWNTFSDRRLKKNIREIQNPVDKVMNLRGVDFDWIRSGEPSTGFIAQEVEKVLPEIVSTDGEGFKSLDYAKITPVLVEAVKAQERALRETRKEIDALKALVRSLASGREHNGDKGTTASK